MGEHQHLARRQVRRDRLAVELRLAVVSGTRIMITSAQRRGLGRRRHRRGRRPRAFARDLLPAGRPTRDVHAAVLQVQRVRVALDAVADDRDLLARGSARGRRPCRSTSSPCVVARSALAIDRLSRIAAAPTARSRLTDRHAAVVDGCRRRRGLRPRRGLRRRAPSRRGRSAPSRGCRRAAARRRRPSILSSAPVISTISESGATSTTRARKTSTSCMICAARLGGAATLISARSRSTVGSVRDVVDAQHVHQLVEVRLDAARAALVGVDDDRHARDAGLSRCGRRSAIDVEGAAAEQRRDAVQHARLVFDVRKRRQCDAWIVSAALGFMARLTQSGSPVSTSGLGRRIIACRSAPAGTIG